ncbi:hypothetical protein MHYP_G00237750 [Metynnis hypsauchen]
MLCYREELPLSLILRLNHWDRVNVSNYGSVPASSQMKRAGALCRSRYEGEGSSMEDAMQAIRAQDGWELLGSVPGWCPRMLVFVTVLSDARADWLRRTTYTFSIDVLPFTPSPLQACAGGAQSSGLPDSIKPDCESVPRLPAATGRRAGAQPPASTALNLVIAERNMAAPAPLPHRARGGSKPGASDADMGQREEN